MKKVGQVLKETRLKKGLTLADVEKHTKIRQSVLINLEEGIYNELPAPTYIKGLIKNYGDFLGLPTTSLIALFRREFGYQIKEYYPKSGPSFNFFNLKISPNLTIFSATAMAIIALFAYLTFQYLSLSAAPKLEVNNPQDKISVSTDSIQIIGQTDPDATVTINMGKVNTDQDGNFKDSFKLTEGQNTIEIIATNKFNKSKKVVRIIDFHPQ